MKYISTLFLFIFLLGNSAIQAQETKKPEPSFNENLRNANFIQSKYLQLQNGYGDMTLLGDPSGNGVFNNFRYNYGDSNKYIIFTGLAVPDPNNQGTYLKPVMRMLNPNNPPMPTAFEATNVTNQATMALNSYTFPADRIDYWDKIDGYSGLPNPDGIYDGFTVVATVNGFRMEHTVQIVLNTYTERPDGIEFFFSVTNTSSQARVFGLSWNVDTYIGSGSGDHAPFYVAGLQQFKTNEVAVGFPIPAGSAAEIFYDSKSLFQIGFNPYTNSVPEYFYPLHPTENWSGLIRTNLGLKNGILWQKADYVAIADYFADIIRSNYFCGVNNGAPGSNDDSEHMLRWDPQVVKPGETIHLAYSYGAGAGKNFQDGVVNFMDIMSPAIIETDPQKLYYTNAPFTSETKIANQTFANITSGTITLKIPRAYLRIENSMLQGNKWRKNNTASGSDPVYDYYTYNVGAVAPSQAHLVNPPVDLAVIPQYQADVNTSYWLLLDAATNIPVDIVPNSIEKNLFIPKLNYIIITATTDGNGTISPNGNVGVEYGNNQAFTFTPNVNYVIANVFVDDVPTPQAVLDGSYTFGHVTEEHTIYVTFDHTSCFVSVSANPTDGGAVDGDGEYNFGERATVTAYPNDCYNFVNWTVGGVGVSTDNPYSFDAENNIALVANFEKKTFNVTVAADPTSGGNPTVTGSGTGIPCGTQVTVQANPNSIYNFVNWTDENGTEVSQNANFSFILGSDTSLIAHYTLKTYIITTTENPSAGGTTTINGYTYTHFDPVHIEASANTGYHFEHWTVGVGGTVFGTNPDTTFTATQSLDLVAKFKINTYPITLLASPLGTGNPSGGGSKEHFQEITVFANPISCFKFVHWTEEDTIVLPIAANFSFEVTKPRTLTAHFTPTTFNVEVSTSDDSRGEVSGGGTDIPCMETIHITATPKPKYVFDHWEENGLALPTSIYPASFDLYVTRNFDLVAHFEPEKYNIIVRIDPVDAGQEIYGTGYNIPLNTPWEVKVEPFAGYDFAGWTYQDGTMRETANSYSFLVDSSLVLVANFRPKTYKITVTSDPPQAAEPTSLSGAGYFQHMEMDTLRVEPKNTWRFLYWTEADDDEVFAYNPIYPFPVTKSMDLVAHFERDKYNIIAKANPEESAMVELSEDNPILYGTYVTATATPNHDQWRLLNWSRVIEKDTVLVQGPFFEYSFNVTQACTILANFEKKRFDIIVSATPGAGGIALQNSYNIPYDTDTAVYAIPNPNWVFAGWTENGDTVSKEQYFPFPVTRSRNLTANFVKENFEITVLAEPTYGGTVEGAGIYPFGKDTAINAIANPHFSFIKWTKEDATTLSTDAYHPFTVAQSHRWTALFEAERFKITVAADPNQGGGVSGDGVFDYGTTVTVTARPDPCYEFLYWTENEIVVSGDDLYTFTVEGDRDLVAHFEIKLFSIITEPNPAAYGATFGDEDDIPCGEERTVTATPEIGYAFIDWTDEKGHSVSTNEIYSFNIFEDINLTANFEERNHVITLEPRPWIGGSVWDEGTFPHGSLITVHAEPNPEYNFVEWTEDGINVSYGADYTFTVEDSRHLVANFEWKTLTVTTATTPQYIGNAFPAVAQIPYGEIHSVWAVPEPHFHLTYWTINNVNVSSYGQLNYSFPVTESCEVVAHFEPDNYSIILRKNPEWGGTVSGGGNNIPYGTVDTVWAFPFPGYEFDSWTEEDSHGGTSVVSTNTTFHFTVTNSRILTANFRPAGYDVILSSNMPGAMLLGQGYGIPFGTDTVVSASYSGTDYHFSHWKEGDWATTENPYSFKVTNSRYLEAIFDLNQFEIKVYANPHYAGNTTGGGQNIPFGTYDTVRAFPKSAFFTFDRWTDENGIQQWHSYEYGYTVTGNRTLVAQFNAVMFNIGLSKIPLQGGTVEGGGQHGYGSTLTITAIPDTCYSFTGWYEEDTLVTANINYTFTVEGDRDFEARFQEKTFSITTNATTGGTAFGDDSQIPCRDMRTVTAIAELGYIFVNWTDSQENIFSDMDIFTFSVKKDLVLTANFEERFHNITLSVAPSIQHGTVWQAGTYPHGYILTVHAQANPEYSFVCWVENGMCVSDTTDYTFTVDSARNLVAHFQAKTLNVTTRANPRDGGITFGDQSDIIYGENITVQAIENPHYHFKNWTKNGDVVSAPGQWLYTFPVIESCVMVANFEPDRYDIILKREPPEGGTVSGGGFNIPYNTADTVRAFPYPHSEFVCWTELNEQGMDSVVSTDAAYPFTVIRSRTLTAHFRLKAFDLILTTNPSSGAGIIAGTGYNIPHGTDTAAYAFPDADYHFKYWKEGEIIIYENPYKFKLTQTRHLEAVFELNGFDVIVLINPPEGGTVTGGGTNIPSGTLEILRAYHEEFYTFEKWTDEDGNTLDYNPVYQLTVLKSCTLVAHFTAITSKITLLANPTQGGDVEGAGDIPQGKQHTIHALPKPNYDFVNWTEDDKWVSDDKDHTFIVDEQDHTYVANFKLVTFDINISASPQEGGTVSGGGTFDRETQITIAAQELECYSFTGWYEQDELVNENTEYTFNVRENRELVAKFIPLKYNITATANNPNRGEVTGGGYNLNCRQEVTVTATPFSGYLFVNWTLNGEVVSNDSCYKFIATQSGQWIANFEENIKLITLNANPPNMGTVTGGGEKLYGEQITVTATPISGGFSFIKWTENQNVVSEEEEYSFVVTQDRNLVAHFQKTTYTITVDVNDPLYGTASGGGVYEPNQTATIKAFVKEGYRFANWTIDDSIVSVVNTFEFIVTKNLHIVANFYGLDFDTYAATLWDNTFMLDLNKLAKEGYELTGCKWFKNGIQEMHTNTFDEFSYSAGPNSNDHLELDPTFYFFQITTKNGSILYSTRKVIQNYMFYNTPPTNGLIVYPNPATTGSEFNVENIVPETMVQVFNQFGVCVKNIWATNEKIAIALKLPAGIYLIKNEKNDAKIIILK